ncbi:MAG: leucine-rich repeat domain-containing protein [Treponema sp.]|jgi:hypothetical protein|nr:leucine-rich repeat domain-containing protein [Treponema sp.]
MTMKTKTIGLALFLFTILCFTVLGQNLSDFRVRLNETGNTQTISVIAYTGTAKDITIPAQINDVPVRIIERGAFQSLTSLTRVTLPFGVTTIESGAFNGCSALVSLSIPATVTSISTDTFSGCSSLTTIEVDPRNQQYMGFQGVLFDKAGITLLYYPSGKIGDYSVPDSVKNVAPGAFIDADKLSLESYNEITQRFGSAAFGVPSGQSPDAPSNSVSSATATGVASSVSARRSQGPVLPGRSKLVYYVSAQGNDANNGLSEAAPFRTLSKAIEATATGPVRTITVIGRVEGGFILTNINGELLITGKPDATETEKASIEVSSGLVLQVNGFTKLRLEHIEITGGTIGGIRVDNGAFLTLGTGARVSGNVGANGGGVNIHGQNTTLVMEGNATITGNIANAGGGVFIWESGMLVMKNIATITGNRVIQGVNEYGRGGGVFMQDAYFIMQDSTEVSGNRTFASGGGLFALRSNITMRDGAVIKDNSSVVAAGGAYLYKGALTMEGNAEISGNSAATNGGGVELSSIEDDNGSTVLLRESARIANNYAAMRGGGLFIGKNNRVVLQDDAEISGNQAQNGGGVREEQGARLILDTTASIRNNTASLYPDISTIN